MMLDNTDDDVQQWLKERSIYGCLKKVVQRFTWLRKKRNQVHLWSYGEQP
jgi:hypothetical protein